MRTLFVLVWAVEIHAACVAIEGERIRAVEMATTIGAFRALEAEKDLGPAPAPNVKRTLTRIQLARMLGPNALSQADLPETICVARALQPIAAADMQTAVEAAVRALLGEGDHTVELLDYPKQPILPGALKFSRSGILSAASKAIDGPILWRGALISTGKRSVPVWARVRVLTKRECLVSKEQQMPGSMFREEAFDKQTLLLNPFSASGMCGTAIPGQHQLRRTLRAGALLLEADLQRAPSIRRGASVSAEVHQGMAKFSFPAVAETDGEQGGTLLIRNPTSGKRLRARVGEDGKVIVQ